MKPLLLSALSASFLLLPLPLAAQAPAPSPTQTPAPAPPPPPASAPSATNPPATRRTEPARTPAVSQAIHIPAAPAQPVTAAPEKCPLLTTDIDSTEFNFRIAAQLPPTADGRLPEPRVDCIFPYTKTLSYQSYGLNIAASFIGSKVVRLGIFMPCTDSSWPSVAKAFGLPPETHFEPDQITVVPGDGPNWVTFERSGDQIQIIISSRDVFPTAGDAADDQPGPAAIDSQLREIGNMLKPQH